MVGPTNTDMHFNRFSLVLIAIIALAACNEKAPVAEPIVVPIVVIQEPVAPIVNEPVIDVEPPTQAASSTGGRVIKKITIPLSR